jgi:hypothetical protein
MKVYAQALCCMLFDRVVGNSYLRNRAMILEAQVKQLYRWGSPKRGEFVLRRKLDGFKQLKTGLGLSDELVFLKISFALACKEEYDRKFPNGDELQILSVIE